MELEEGVLLLKSEGGESLKLVCSLDGGEGVWGVGGGGESDV